MSGLSVAIKRFRAQCEGGKPPPRPKHTTLVREPGEQSSSQAINTTIEALAEEATSDTSFHSAIDSNRSPSPSPTPLTGPNMQNNDRLSTLIVELQTTDPKDLAEYKSVELASDDEHFPKEKLKPQGVDGRPTPPGSSSRMCAIKRHMMEAAGPESDSDSSSVSINIFDDDPIAWQIFGHNVVELEDPDDEDWVADAPRSRSRLANSTPGNSAASDTKTTSFSTTPRGQALASEPSQSMISRPSRLEVSGASKSQRPTNPWQASFQEKSNANQHTKTIVKPTATPIYEEPQMAVGNSTARSRLAPEAHTMITLASQKPRESLESTSTETAAERSKTAWEASSTSNSQAASDATPVAAEINPLLSCIKSKYRSKLSINPMVPSSGAKKRHNGPDEIGNATQTRGRVQTETPAAFADIKERDLMVPETQKEAGADCQITGVSPVVNMSNPPAKKPTTPIDPRTTTATKEKAPSKSVKQVCDPDIEFDSELKTSCALPCRGQDSENPVEIDSDLEITKVTPRKHQKKTQSTVWRRISAASLSGTVQYGQSASIVSGAEAQKERVEVDLTMLSSSDESDIEEDDDSASSGENDLDSGGGEGSSSSSEDVDEVVSQADSAYNAQATETPHDTASRKASALSPVSAMSNDGSRNENVELSASEIERAVRREMANWKWFDYRDVSPPLTSERLDKIQAEREAKDNPGEQLAHQAANDQRWIEGEPFVPFGKLSAKRERESDDGGDDEDGAKDKTKRRKLNELASSNIRDGIREGMVPRLIRPRRHESALLFGGRIVKFKLAGWKKKVVRSKQRRSFERSLLVGKWMLKACKEERRVVRMEELKEVALKEMASLN